jgi:SAM-dependent methyltransferase
MQVEYRTVGEKLFYGLSGVEVGGLNAPLRISGTKMEYIDVISMDEARALFPEVREQIGINNLYLGDVSSHSITEITGKQYDFVISNNVIEHVANPILFLKNLLDGVRNGGYLLISAPDKNMCFDRDRALTEFNHVLADYYLDTKEADPTHYIDFLIHVHPEFLRTKTDFINVYHSARNRREHVHVWDKHTFHTFLEQSLRLLEIEYTIIFHNLYNGMENFTILQLYNTSIGRNIVCMNLLKMIYNARPDFKKAFPILPTIFPPFSQSNGLRSLIIWAIHSREFEDPDAMILSQYESEYTYYLENIQEAILAWKGNSS